MNSASGARAFVTTHWTAVLAAASDSSSPAARDALETLCRTYWPPLYAFARRSGYASEDARDLTQGFFERLIERGGLAASDPTRGRFRTFLLAMFKHHLAHERDRAHALRRGGGQALVPLDVEPEEAGIMAEPADWWTPDRAYEQRWATLLLQRVLERLREEFTLSGRGGLFDQFKGFLTGDSPTGGYAETAARLGMTEGAAKMTVTRMRERYRHLLRAEIAQTVETPSEVEDELRYLRQVLNP